MLKKYSKYLTRKNLIYGGSALAVLLVGFMLFGGNGDKQMQTVVVQEGPFEQTISVAGKVTPAREVALGFTSGGRVAQVNARVGSTVAQGSVIAAIDASDLRVSVQQREAALENQKSRLEAVKQGPRPEEIAVAQSTADSDAIALKQANGVVIDAIKDAYVKADDAVRVQVYQFMSNPRTYNPQVNFLSTNGQAVIDVQSGVMHVESMLTAWQSEIAGLSAESDVVAAAAKAQVNLAAVLSLLSRASVALGSAIPNSTVTATNLATYVVDIGTARTSLSSSNTSISTSVTAQRNAVASLEAAKKNLSLKQAGPVQADVDAQAAQVRSAEADLANAKLLLGKALIIAPFTGVITTMDAKVGAIVGPSTPLITMIGSGTFQIESYVPEVNIGLVAVNNPAEVTLDAYGDDVTFDARVVSIDPAATLKDGVPTYRAVLQFTTADPRIKSGMTANVVITTAEMENVLSVPQGIIIDRDKKKYVQVLDGQTIVEREVTVGTVSSLGQAEILTGLRDGDTIVLSESAE